MTSTVYLSSPPTSSPQIHYKPSDENIHYKQKVFIRWLKPPTPPPSGPIIIREIPSAPVHPPPVVYRCVARCPPTPPPIVLREPVPPCQIDDQQPILIERCLPPVCCSQQEKCCRIVPQRKLLYDQCCSPCLPQVQCEKRVCQSVPTQCRRIVKEVIRRIPQPQPTTICSQHQQNIIKESPPSIEKEIVPVFATRQRIVQPKGIRVIRQVIGPATSSIH